MVMMMMKCGGGMGKEKKVTKHFKIGLNNAEDYVGEYL